jgi:hypothetical protein
MDRRRLLLSTEVLDPQLRDIALDVCAALRAETQPALPPVRFVPARWEEGYT